MREASFWSSSAEGAHHEPAPRGADSLNGAASRTTWRECSRYSANLLERIALPDCNSPSHGNSTAAEPPPARLHPHGCAAVLPPGRPLGIARGDPASPSQQGDGFARGVPPLGLPPPARRLRAVQPGWLAHASPPGTLRLPAVAVLAAKAAGTAGAEPPPARRHPHGLRRSAASGPPPWDRQRRSRFAATARWRLRLRGSRPSDTRIRPIGADAPLERSWARFASPPSRGRLGLRRLRPLARSSASPGGVRPRCVRPDRPYTAGADTTITFPYSCGKRLPTQIFTHVSYASF